MSVFSIHFIIRNKLQCHYDYYCDNEKELLLFLAAPETPETLNNKKKFEASVSWRLLELHGQIYSSIDQTIKNFLLCFFSRSVFRCKTQTTQMKHRKKEKEEIH